MVQHTLVVKNIASAPLFRHELAKLLGAPHKIITVNFTRRNGVIKSAKVYVESKSKIATVIGLIDKKTVTGKEIQVSAAKPLHESPSYLRRVAQLKQLEKYPTRSPPLTYKSLARSDPLKNGAFPPVVVGGERLAVQLPKTIKKKERVPSIALQLSNIPSGVTKKQILAPFKGLKVKKAHFAKTTAVLVFKDAEARQKAQEATIKDNNLTIDGKTIPAKESEKYSFKTVEVPRVIKPAKQPADIKDLSANGIARRRFIAYRKQLHLQKRKLVRAAAVRKANNLKAAIAKGNVKRAVRQIKPKKAANPAVLKKAAQEKNKKKQVHKKVRPTKKVAEAPKAKATTETATA